MMSRPTISSGLLALLCSVGSTEANKVLRGVIELDNGNNATTNLGGWKEDFANAFWHKNESDGFYKGWKLDPTKAASPEPGVMQRWEVLGATAYTNAQDVLKAEPESSYIRVATQRHDDSKWSHGVLTIFDKLKTGLKIISMDIMPTVWDENNGHPDTVKLAKILFGANELIFSTHENVFSAYNILSNNSYGHTEPTCHLRGLSKMFSITPQERLQVLHTVLKLATADRKPHWDLLSCKNFEEGLCFDCHTYPKYVIEQSCLGLEATLEQNYAVSGNVPAVKRVTPREDLNCEEVTMAQVQQLLDQHQNSTQS